MESCNILYLNLCFFLLSYQVFFHFSLRDTEKIRAVLTSKRIDILNHWKISFFIIILWSYSYLGTSGYLGGILPANHSGVDTNNRVRCDFLLFSCGYEYLELLLRLEMVLIKLPAI